MPPHDGEEGVRKRPAWQLGAGGLGITVIVGVVVAVVLISSGDDEVAGGGMAPPADGDCGNALSGERSRDQVLVTGSVNCETAVKLIEGLDNAPADNPGLIGGGKTVTVEGTDWSCGPPTPSVECTSDQGTVTDMIVPGS